MRIQRQIFLFTLDIKSNISENFSVTLEDRSHSVLESQHEIKNGIHRISTKISLPNKILLQIIAPQDAKLEIVGATLAGIRINKDKLFRIFEFYRGKSLSDYHQTVPDRNIDWSPGGVALFNFFAINPFIFLLQIGNKISI